LHDAAPLKRGVAKRFMTGVEENHESTVNVASNANCQLVDTELEMVRAGRLLYGGAAVGRVRWLDTLGRLQRNEIN
jgi:alanine racemase